MSLLAFVLQIHTIWWLFWQCCNCVLCYYFLQGVLTLFVRRSVATAVGGARRAVGGLFQRLYNCVHHGAVPIKCGGRLGHTDSASRAHPTHCSLLLHFDTRTPTENMLETFAEPEDRRTIACQIPTPFFVSLAFNPSTGSAGARQRTHTERMRRISGSRGGSVSAGPGGIHLRAHVRCK